MTEVIQYLQSALEQVREGIEREDSNVDYHREQMTRSVGRIPALIARRNELNKAIRTLEATK
jgi:hypothetical protein